MLQQHTMVKNATKVLGQNVTGPRSLCIILLQTFSPCGARSNLETPEVSSQVPGLATASPGLLMRI